jgi:hypothetical protein
VERDCLDSLVAEPPGLVALVAVEEEMVAEEGLGAQAVTVTEVAVGVEGREVVETVVQGVEMGLEAFTAQGMLCLSN